MVRARSLVLALMVLAAVALGARGQSLPAEPKAAPPERRPYAIRAWLAVDPGTRLDRRQVKELLEDWHVLVSRFVGAPWALDSPVAEGRFAVVPPEELRAEDFASAAAGFDKLWVIRIAPGSGRGYVLSGREYDTLTRTLGAVSRRDVIAPSDASRGLLQFALQLFTPTAEVGNAVGDRVQLTVQGSLLTPASPVGTIAPPGTVFTPLRIFRKPDGSVARILPIGWTYLVVDSLDGPTAQATLVTGLPDPLSRRVVGSYRLVALGVKSGDVPTRFRFETRPPDPQPAAGYSVVARALSDDTPREIGSTDRDGRFELPAGFGRKVILLRLLAGGFEPLVEFPVLPGESDEMRVVRINPLPQTIALETRLNALKDELVDLVAVRARLEARLKSRAEANEWEDVKLLLDEFHRLKAARIFTEQLTALRDEAARQQAETKTPILTRTAQAQIADAESLIGRYLDDELFQAYENAYKESQGGAVMAPSADWKPFSPQGVGVSVLIPGTPTASAGQLATGAGNLPLRLWSTKYENRAYVVGVAEPATGTHLADAAAQRAHLEKLRDQLLTNNPGYQLVEERQLVHAGLNGLDLRLTSRPDGGAPAGRVHRQRFLVAENGRVFVQIVVGNGAGAEARDASVFFNSFKPTVAPAKPKAATPQAS